MAPPDFDRLEVALTQDCRRVIADFVSSGRNDRVYAFVLMYDPFHADVSVHWNTEQALAEMLVKCSESNIDAESALLGFRGFRYSAANFEYQLFPDSHDECGDVLGNLSQHLQSVTDELQLEADELPLDLSEDEYCEKFDQIQQRERQLESEYYTGFDECMLHCLKRLESDFDRFNKTEDFIAYLTKYEGDEAGEIGLMRLTVPQNQFRRLFPAIHEYEEHCRAIAGWPIEEQIEYWLGAVVDLKLNLTTDRALKLRGWRRYLTDACQKLQALGAAACPGIIEEFRMRAVARELNSQARSDDAANRSDELAEILLFSLDAIRECSAGCVRNLHRVLQLLFNDAYGKGTINPTLGFLAKTLNRLDWDKFPEPADIDGGTNHLLNWQAFKLTLPEK